MNELYVRQRSYVARCALFEPQQGLREQDELSDGPLRQGQAQLYARRGGIGERLGAILAVLGLISDRCWRNCAQLDSA